MKGTDEWINGRMTDRQIERQTAGRTDRQMDKWIKGQRDGQTDRQMDK